MATFTLPHEMTLYASVRGDWNDYDATLGRRAYDTLGGSLQWEWQPSPATIASAWYGYDRSDLDRSEEHTSELQSLMRISYAVFCLKKKKQITTSNHNNT